MATIWTAKAVVHDCMEPNILYNHDHLSNLYVRNCLMLADTVHYWTVDSAATDHIPRDRGFVEFRQISKCSECIYIGNNVSAVVLRIGTCKLVLQGDHTLYIHDMLYAPKFGKTINLPLFLWDQNLKFCL